MGVQPLSNDHEVPSLLWEPPGGPLSSSDNWEAFVFQATKPVSHTFYVSDWAKCE